MKTRKPLHLTMGVLLIAAAALQYNDRDALAWAAMYALAAAVTFWRAFRPPPLVLAGAAAILCFGAAAWTASREYLNPGCMIGSDVPGPLACGLWLAYVAYSAVPLPRRRG